MRQGTYPKKKKGERKKRKSLAVGEGISFLLVPGKLLLQFMWDLWIVDDYYLFHLLYVSLIKDF